MTIDTAFFCPSCGSPCVDASTLSGGDARCESCGWAGKREDLLVHAFSHDHGSQEEVARAFVGDVRTVFGRDVALPLGRVLVKWGFVDGEQPKLLGRYLLTIVRAAALAIIQERKQLEQEREEAAHVS